MLTEKNPKAIELFQQEAKVLSQLNSAGIPKVEPDGYFTVLPKNSSVPLHCLAMEKIEGVNLEQWMEFRNYQRRQPLWREIPIPEFFHKAIHRQSNKTVIRYNSQTFLHWDELLFFCSQVRNPRIKKFMTL